MGEHVKLDLSQIARVSEDLRIPLLAGLEKVRDHLKDLVAAGLPVPENSPIRKLVLGEPVIQTGKGKYEARVSSAKLAGKPAREGVLHEASGATRPVRLRATQPADVVRFLSEGAGVFGPTGQVIRPKRASVLLIGVKEVPLGEEYIQDGNQKFIVRPQSKGMRGNDFVDRAVTRLEFEIADMLTESIARVTSE